MSYPAKVTTQNQSVLIKLNFWEAKQLEYWLKDNYPSCGITVVNGEGYCPPDIKEYYAVTGEVGVDLACILKLKYGDI